MSKIIFFSIPAHGHTNPTLPVVRELVNRGHEVWYYSFLEFQEKIQAAGASFIACDEYLPKLSPEELDRKAGKDFAALIEMVADTTIALDAKVCKELQEYQPDCIVSDSLSFWGKLFAKKLNIPYICSTTTFAFNQHTARLMKRSFWELLRMVLGMPRINKKMKMLRDHGYDVRSFISIVQNDNDTNTIVYTSKEFQPMANTFSERYAFVGPSIRTLSPQENNIKDRQVIYISLGTVLNKNREFYNNCINAFAQSNYTVVMSVGEKTEIKSLGIIPNNFVVRNTVDQISVLQTADAFITHSGMNSVSESLYFGVPMVLFPQHSEQKMVANRVAELGAGVLLKGKKRADLAASVTEVLTNLKYEENAKKLSKSLRNAGGAVEAANVILEQAQSAY
ncbi:glycosyltransferase [Paenibacillus urinalis]|uniref:Glycosyltransferase n=1 Tax=Paenibacillus urinalis TaxID=521520 RepID=A0ABY7X3B6_9BACL|nr:macrolide family glycosyltransferase [Paenibacillus urinalis]WDH96691.1 glycosyltransferase [Paenibacillus urinalis]WDI00335.1 glycosyltransferase [Paenibacillus urinalis]